METRYTRNRIYLTESEQSIIKNYPILLGGCGIGSVIAECALRFGFENIKIVDGDDVERSNLNRQNYTEEDISKSKTEALKERLLSINKKAKISSFDSFLTPDNIIEQIKGCKIAINALDFSSDAPLLFDKLCQENNIPVLHPYNIGWAGLVTVIDPEGLSLDSIKNPEEDFNEVKMVEYALGYLNYWGISSEWMNDVISKFKNEKENLSPPQLAVASWTLASMCTHLLFDIATRRSYKRFPKFYMSSLMSI